MKSHIPSTPFDGSAVGSALSQVIAATERSFPDRVCGYYLHGSTADDTSIETSDVDLSVLVKNVFVDVEERVRFASAVRRVARRTGFEMDVDVTDEASLQAGAEPTFKLGSRLVYGEDIRERVPLIPVEDWGRDRMYAGHWLMVKVFNRPSRVRVPIDFPDPDSEFFGYTERKVTLPDGRRVDSTRDLVRVTGWLATALLAHEAGQYVVRKRDCHRLYREHFHDEWASLLEEIYVSCRCSWGYLVPTEPADRRDLRTLCRRALDFENHFLTRFKPFLLEELERSRLGEENRAVGIMHEIPFDDDEVSAALRRSSG